MRFKFIALFVLFFIISSLILPLTPIELFKHPVKATTGITTVNLTLTSSDYKAFNWYASATGTFAEKCIATTCSSLTGGTSSIGWTSTDQSGAEVTNPMAISMRFNYSTLPTDVDDIISIQFHFTPTVKTNTSGIYSEQFYGLFNTDWGADETIDITDNDEWVKYIYTDGRLCTPFRYTALTVGSEYKVTLPDKDSVLKKYGASNYGYLQLMTEEHWQYRNPSYEHDKSMLIQADWTAAHLEISYATPPPSRTMNQLANAAVYSGTIYGTENITGIDWLTPRCAFNDENIGWEVAGDQGAAFTYSLFDSKGTILEAESDNQSIRVNGYFYHYWQPTVDYTGYIRLRARQITTGQYFYSPWGYVNTIPDDTQINLTTQYGSTDSDYYETGFSNYIIYKNGLGFCYWKTNIEASDMGLYSFRFLIGGDIATSAYTVNMSDMITDYFQIHDTNNNAQAAYRYLIFTPFKSATGFNTYDNLIINAGKDYTVTNCGFWQPTIIKNADNSYLVTTNTAPFYINNISQGLTMIIKDDTSGDYILNLHATVGDNCRIGTRLNTATLEVLDDEGNSISSDSGIIAVGENVLDFILPETVGDYILRVSLSNDTYVTNYDYIQDLPFKIATGGTVGSSGTGTSGTGTDVLAYFTNWLTAKGWFTSFGKSLIILLLMLVLFFLTMKDKILRVVLPCLVLVIAFMVGWINPWIGGAIGLVLGLFLYRALRRVTQGGD